MFSDTVSIFVILGILAVFFTLIENKNKKLDPNKNYVPKMVDHGPQASVVPCGTIFYTEDGGGRTYTMNIENSMDNFTDGTILSFNLRKKNTA